MTLVSFLNKVSDSIGNTIANYLHNMLLNDVHCELNNIINILDRAQSAEEELLLCPHCNYLFDLDDCLWADLDDTREGSHFNCRANGFGHTCPRCEKKSRNKLIQYRSNNNNYNNKIKYMDLRCFSGMFGKAVSRTSQTIAWCVSCPCLSCRSNIFSLELCTNFGNSMYEPFELREENQPLYNTPRHQYACNITINIKPGIKIIYFGDLSPELYQDDKYIYVYRDCNEPIGKKILLNENTVEAALISLGLNNKMKITLPYKKNIDINDFLSKKINECWRDEIHIFK